MPGALLFNTPYGTARPRVLRALEQATGWLTPRELQATSRVTITNVRYQLYDLLDQGIVERRQLAGCATKYEYRLKQGETT